jgi:ATP-dependent DNA helicase RecG
MSEHQYLEWKASWRDDYLKWICAFANGEGGILQVYREKGVPSHRIRVEPGDFWFEFPLSSTYIAEIAGEAQSTSSVPTQERILVLLRENPRLTQRALADRLGMTADGIKYHLRKLRETGRIRNVGPTKKGRWEVLENE